MALLAGPSAAGCGDGDGPTSPSGGPPLSFFVSSATSATGNLGGLAGADAICQRLATAVGQGSGRLWRAYLSVERDASNGNRPTNARDRIGLGPWHNANGVAVANNLTELHTRSGDAAVFIDERGQRINGTVGGVADAQRARHPDRLDSRGTLMAGLTCADWTSASTDGIRRRSATPTVSGAGAESRPGSARLVERRAHECRAAANTAPGGGAGRIYCFAR